MGERFFTEDPQRPGVVLTPDGTPMERETARRAAPAQFAASFPGETAAQPPLAPRITPASDVAAALRGREDLPVGSSQPIRNIPTGSLRADLSGSTASSDVSGVPSVPSGQPAQGETVDVGADPMSPFVQRIRELRAQPQVTRTGGGVRTSTTTQAIDPESRASAQDVQGDIERDQSEAEFFRERQAEAEEKSTAALANIAGEQAAKIEEFQAQQEADRAAFDRRFAQETEKLDELQQQARTDIDPKRWWRSKSTGESLLAALAMAAGQFSTAFTGGPNAALGIIDNAIARDIDAQLQNRQDKRQAAADQRGFMSMLRDQYSSLQDERKAGMIVGRELAAAQAEQVAQQAASQTVRSRMGETAALLRAENARQAQDFILRSAGQVTTNQVRVPGGAGASSAAREAAQLESAVFAPFDQKKLIPGAEGVLGFPVMAASDSEAKELRGEISQVQHLMANAAKIEALGKKGSKLSPQDRQTMAALYSDSITTLNKVKGLGVLAGPDLDLLKDELGPKPTDFVAFSNGMPGFRATLQQRARLNLHNKTFRPNPDSVPLSQRARFQNAAGGGVGGGGRPETRPLDQ